MEDIIERIKQCLEKTICSDYILLDLPYYPNVGDVLIWQSTLDILKEIKHKCLYSASIETYRKPNINSTVTIVFLGGGNFGDLWERHQIFRHIILREFIYNPIVQLPQSVWFESDEKFNRDIDVWSHHKGPVSILLRDKQSFDIINASYRNVKAFLCPDMAFAFDVSRYRRLLAVRYCKGEGTLILQRADKEVASVSPFCADSSDISDWPCMESQIWQERIFKIISHYVSSKKFHDWYYRLILKNVWLRMGMRFLQKYEIIVTTRLHGGILAMLMGKNVYLIDNNYRKISGVYNLWMKDSQNVTML